MEPDPPAARDTDDPPHRQAAPPPAADHGDDDGAGPVDWQWSTMDDIAPRALHALLALRSRVFVVEQRCLYEDADAADDGARFLIGSVAGVAVATLRLLAPGARFAEASLGRVCVARAQRRLGLGRALMREGLRGCARHHPGQPIRLSAQSYLTGFYRGFGFAVASAPYLEDGIPHVEMLRPAGPVSPPAAVGARRR